MCPGCPTFSIPVPVPKSTLDKQQQQQQLYQQQLPYDPLGGASATAQDDVKYQYARNMTFLEKIGNSVISTMQGIQVKKWITYVENSLEIGDGSESGHCEKEGRSQN